VSTAIIAIDHRRVLVSVAQTYGKFVEIRLIADAGAVSVTDRTLQLVGMSIRRKFNSGVKWVRVTRDFFGKLQDAALNKNISPEFH
jgi:hypothetical protein